MASKKCDYCSNSFLAKRSDTKYCSKVCKQEAYIARKSGIGLAGSDLTYNDVYESKRPINVNPSMTIPKTEYNRLVNRNQTKAPLDHLLKEKDYGRDVLAENAKMTVEMKYMNEKLMELKNRVITLEEQNGSLKDEADKYEASFASKAIDFCNKNPHITSMLATLGYKLTGGDVAEIGSLIPTAEPPTSNDEPIDNEELIINDQLDKIAELYPDKNLSGILGKFLELLNSNKTMVDQFIYSD